MSESSPCPSGTAEQPQEAHLRSARAFRPVLWRLHFFSGFLIAPVVLSMAITGIIYAWHPQVERFIFGSALTAVSDDPARPLSEQVRAATGEYPDLEVAAVVPAEPEAPEAAQTTAVTLSPSDPGPDRFGQDAGVTTVYVDPGTARVTGEILEANRPNEWIRNLHSNWRVGQESWLEPLSELAASWALVSLLTGLYLWWSIRRRRRSGPGLRTPIRERWLRTHTMIGIVVLVPLLLMVGTGLTWTRYAGAWVDVVKEGVAAPAPELNTALPAGSSPNGSSSGASASWAEIDRVTGSARDAGLDGAVEISPPSEAGTAWEVESLDDRWPIEESALAIDPGTGQVIDRVEWAEKPLLDKATALGTRFHEAKLFGPASQVGLTALALALITLLFAGYRMWWRRRPLGEFGAPPKIGTLIRTVPIPVLAAFIALMVLLPTLGVSFLAFLVIERLIHLMRHRKTTG